MAKAKDVGVTKRAVAGLVIVSVTVTVCGDPVAPEAEIVRCPVYVPVVSPEMLHDATTVPAPVPLVGLPLSHDSSEETVQLRVPPFPFVTETFWLAGLELNSGAVKLRVVGVTSNIGVDEALPKDAAITAHVENETKDAPKDVLYVPGDKPAIY